MQLQWYTVRKKLKILREAKWTGYCGPASKFEVSESWIYYILAVISKLFVSRKQIFVSGGKVFFLFK
jgi:hypothetical protein